jgi:hypothetical protein
MQNNLCFELALIFRPEQLDFLPLPEFNGYYGFINKGLG